MHDVGLLRVYGYKTCLDIMHDILTHLTRKVVLLITEFSILRSNSAYTFPFSEWSTKLFFTISK